MNFSLLGYTKIDFKSISCFSFKIVKPIGLKNTFWFCFGLSISVRIWFVWFICPPTARRYNVYKVTFGCVFCKLGTAEERCIVNVCQPGNNLLAAGYCMYSSSVIFVLTLGKGVFAFTLDPMYGEFVLTQENIEIPKAGKIYSFNEGNYQMWDENLKKYIDDLKDPGPSGKPYSARYIGSLVGDFHRTLLYGGIYGYPRDQKSKNGKLRLLYECAPMSFIVEQAGGKGSDGHQRVLDIQPTEVTLLLLSL